MGSVQYEDLAVTAVDPTDVHMVRRGAGPYTMALVQDVDPATKQDLLVSGTNIKTINGTTILGSGDLVISVGIAWGAITGTLADQTDLQAALDAKLASSAVSAFGLTLIDDATAGDARTTLELGTLATQSGTFSGTSSGTNTGDQTITLTGEVTGTGTGTFAATIAANAVTYAKIQATALGNVVLGKSGAAGNVTEIQLGLNNLLGRGSSGNLTTITLDATLGFTGAVLGVASGTFALVSGQVFSGAISATNLSGTNTGDQTSIVGITGTKAQFDTAVSDGNILYVGDVTQYTDEMVDDRVSALLVQGNGITLTYNDGANTLTVADGWTYVRLTSDETSILVTNTATALTFTPAANKRYELEIQLLVQSAATTTGPRFAIAWPTGLTDSASSVIGLATSAVATLTPRFLASQDTSQVATTGCAVVDTSYLDLIKGMVTTGGSPSGAFTVQIATEVSLSAVKFMAGSFLKYREIP